MKPIQVKEISVIPNDRRGILCSAISIDKIASLNEQRSILRRPAFVFENGIQTAERKLEEYLKKEVLDIETHTTSEILTLNIERLRPYLWARDVDNHQTSTLLRSENQDIQIIKRKDAGSSKEFLENLEEYMKWKLYVTVKEIEDLFEISKTAARRYIKKINAIKSLNDRSKVYALPSIVEKYANKWGFFVCDGWRFHIKRTPESAVLHFIDTNDIGSYNLGLAKVCGRNVDALMRSLISKELIRAEQIDGSLVFFSGDTEKGILQMMQHPKKTNESLSYEDIAQEFKTLLEKLKIKLKPINIKNNKQCTDSISVYLMKMFALINRWTDRRLAKELKDKSLQDACMLKEPLNHQRISEYFDAMSLEEIDKMRAAFIHYLIKEGVIGEDLCYDGFQLDSYGNYNKRTKDGKRFDDETADRGHKGYGRTGHVISDRLSELTLDVELTPSSEHESKHIVNFVIKTKDGLNMTIRYLYADKAFWDADIIKDLSEANITPKIMEKKTTVVAEGQLTLNAFLKGVEIKEVLVGRGGKKKRKIIVDKYKRDLIFRIEDADMVKRRVKYNKHVQKHRVAVERVISRLRGLFSTDHVRVVGKEKVIKHVKMAVLTQLAFAAIAVCKNMRHLIRSTSHITRWED